jgi:hypothetical protein
MRLNDKKIPHLAALALLSFLALVGCFNPQPLNERDAVYCESEGLRRGTDSNAQCALKRADERAQAGIAPESSPVPPPAGPPPPPVRPGGAPQTIIKTVTAGSTILIDFSFSVNTDCVANGLMTLQVDKKPAHGTAITIPRNDYARLSQSSFPGLCGDKKVAGTALEYKANKDYAGQDTLEFETVNPAGRKTIFKVQIKVEKQIPLDDL